MSEDKPKAEEQKHEGLEPAKSSSQAGARPPENSVQADIALLVLRVGIGVLFLFHGVPKLLGGPEMWTQIGQAAGIFGLGFWLGFWGFVAAVAESLGGLALVAGVLVRPFALLMLCVMVVATGYHLDKGDGLSLVGHPMKAGVVFIALLISGAGRFALGRKIPFLRGKCYQ